MAFWEVSLVATGTRLPRPRNYLLSFRVMSCHQGSRRSKCHLPLMVEDLSMLRWTPSM
jgi:hypothetical protein